MTHPPTPEENADPQFRANLDRAYNQPPALPQQPQPWPQSPAAGYPSYSYVHPPQYVPLVRATSGMATASLIFGIAGLFLFCLVIPSLVAVLCGHNAIKETKGGHKGGHGQAVAGLILGYVVMVPAIVWLVFGGIGTIMSRIEGN